MRGTSLADEVAGETYSSALMLIKRHIKYSRTISGGGLPYTYLTEEYGLDFKSRITGEDELKFWVACAEEIRLEAKLKLTSATKEDRIRAVELRNKGTLVRGRGRAWQRKHSFDTGSAYTVWELVEMFETIPYASMKSAIHRLLRQGEILSWNSFMSWVTDYRRMQIRRG